MVFYNFNSDYKIANDVLFIIRLTLVIRLNIDKSR